MFDSNTTSNTRRDGGLQHVLETAVDSIQHRLQSYSSDDPLARERLKLLREIVAVELDKASTGHIDSYSDLAGPILAIETWGEPPNSELTAALKEAHSFFHNNYLTTDDLKQQTIL